MSSNKNNSYDKDDDLKFTPMNIQDSLKLNSLPIPNINGSPMSSGTMYMCFPSPYINIPDENSNKYTNSYTAPMTPYPSNIPNIDKTQMTSPNANMANNSTTNMTNNSTTNMNTNYSGSYPNSSNTSNNPSNYPSSFPSTSSDLEYPSDVNSEDLYSYNKPRVNENYDSNYVNPMDIVRNFILEDTVNYNYYRGSNDKNDRNDVDDIFEKIEDNNSVVLATMKAYRIPYPIAKLLIKNIIKLTIEYKGR